MTPIHYQYERHDVALCDSGWSVTVELMAPQVEPDWPIWISFEDTARDTAERLGLTLDESRAVAAALTQAADELERS